MKYTPKDGTVRVLGRERSIFVDEKGHQFVSVSQATLERYLKKLSNQTKTGPVESRSPSRSPSTKSSNSSKSKSRRHKKTPKTPKPKSPKSPNSPNSPKPKARKTKKPKKKQA